MLSILLALPSKAAKGWYYDEHEDPKPGDPFAADGFGYEKDGMGCIGFGCAVAGGAIPDIRRRRRVCRRRRGRTHWPT